MLIPIRIQAASLLAASSALTWVRSDSAARVAVKLGYQNVFPDPSGFPEWQKMGMPIESTPEATPATAATPETPGLLYGWAMVWTLLSIFTGGMALNLTPCVYPLIPITVSFFGGQAVKGGHSRRRLGQSRQMEGHLFSRPFCFFILHSQNHQKN